MDSLFEGADVAPIPATPHPLPTSALNSAGATTPPVDATLPHAHVAFPWLPLGLVGGVVLLGVALTLIAGLASKRRTPAMWASGTHPDHILSSTERARVTSMGTMVVAIALAAVCSMTLALSLSFPGPWAWVKFLPVGLLWGLIVFSLDRWILSIIPMPEKDGAGDDRAGKAKWWTKWGLVGARVLMTVLVGVVISEPIVMALFAGEINDQLDTMATKSITAKTHAIEATYTAKKTATDKLTQSAVTLADRNVRIKAAALKVAHNNAVSARKIYICEHQGTGTDKSCLALKAAHVVTGDADPLNREGNQTVQAGKDLKAANTAETKAITASQAALTAANNARQTQVDADSNLPAEQKADIAKMTAKVRNNRGLLIREQALGALMKANSSVFWTRWAVFTALIVVDLMPLALKTLSSKNPYETAAAIEILKKLETAEKKAAERAADDQHRDQIEHAANIRERDLDDRVDAKISEAQRQRRLRAALADTSGDDSDLPVPGPSNPSPEPDDGIPSEAGDPAVTGIPDGDGMLIGGRWLLLEPLRGVSHSTPFAPFLARDVLQEYPDRQVVKILAAAPVIGDDARVLDDAFNEMTMPTGIIDQNLAEVLDSGFDPRRGCYVVTHYYPHTLDQWLKTHELTLGEALEVTRQLICGLGAAWKRQYVHLDIKPGNIGMTTNTIVDENGRVEQGVVKVFDFGLLQNWMYENGGHATTDGHAKYTPFYAPHEQITRAKQWISRSADVWGIAATLYKMLTGKPPMWREADAVGLLDSHGRPLDDPEARVDFVRLMRSHSPIPLDALLPDVVPAYVSMLVKRWLSHDPAARNPVSHQEPGKLDRFAPQMLDLIDSLISRAKADGSYNSPVGEDRVIDVAVPGLDLSWRDKTQGAAFPPGEADSGREGDGDDGDDGPTLDGPGPVPPPHAGPAGSTRTER